MDVTALPFNRLLGLEAAQPESGFLVSLPGGLQYTNHVGTVHAGALLALAEAGSGAFLAQHLVPGCLPLVRRMKAKFRKPAHGRIWARALAEPAEMERATAELQAKGKALLRLPVEVVDESGQVVLSAEVEWFISRIVE